jgi:inner membrane protein
MVYAAIYALLQSDDMALLIGSIGLFIVISIVMILTRRLNWYALGAGMEANKTDYPAHPPL